MKDVRLLAIMKSIVCLTVSREGAVQDTSNTEIEPICLIDETGLQKRQYCLLRILLVL